MAHNMVKGRQYMLCDMPQFNTEELEMNSTDRFSTSIVDKNDSSMFQSQRRTRQLSTDGYVASVRVLHVCECIYACIISWATRLALFIILYYTWDT